MRTVPIKDFPWDSNDMQLQYLTCKNHPTARYLTKNPWTRSLHVTKHPDEFAASFSECPCPFSDLVVIVKTDIRERLATEMDSMTS